MTFDYAIIGAGAAGLAAARSLSGAGKRVCLLEARSRVGGRVHTLHRPDLPIPIELGAEFIHGEPESTWRIVDAASLAACELPAYQWWSQDGRWERLDDFWPRLEALRRKIPSLRQDISFEEFLRSQRRLPPRMRAMARNFVEGYHAGYADRISALALRTSDQELAEQREIGIVNRQFRLAGGQDAILAWLRAGLDPERVDLRLGAVVTEVQWSPGSVTVRTRDGEPVQAAALIVTIPIGVWKAPAGQEGAIAFDPPLHEKTKALAGIEVGHVVKILFRFRERFWDDDAFLASRSKSRKAARGAVLSFVHSPNSSMPTWWTTAPIRSPIVVGWAGGHAADALLAEGEGTRVDRALESMAQAWGIPQRKLASMLEDTFTHDWVSDPFSRSAYSYAGVGGQNAHAALARPIGKTLFFAGEATSGDQTGTVAGAIDSGLRAAKQALKIGS